VIKSDVIFTQFSSAAKWRLGEQFTTSCLEELRRLW